MLLRILVAFIALPGFFACVIPPIIASYDPLRGSGYSLGIVFLTCGFIILLWCVRDFLVAGRGTLAPWDPPKHLVIIGLYRYCRNPMYVGVINMIAGWALYTGSPLIVAYCLFMATMFYLRVVYGEELILVKQFGKDWTDYVETVPRWLPNLSCKIIR
jgi:protein-S-isoprenylcysteine O-methyltransferase Ste14